MTPEAVARTSPNAVSFSAAVDELRFIMLAADTPRRVFFSAVRLLNVLPKCLLVVPQVGGAVVAPEPQRHPLLQPSNLFFSYIAACRAKDWNGAIIIEHGATSSEKAELTELWENGEVAE